MEQLSRKERESIELKEKRRREIIQAAMELFEIKGIRNASLREIAKRAELSKGAVYLYFKSKEDLLFQLMIDYINQMISGVDIRQSDTGYQCLSRLADFAKISYGEHRIFKHMTMNFDLFYTQSYPEDLPAAKEYVTTIQTILNQVEAFVERGIKDASLRCDLEPRRTACTFGNLLSTFGGTTAVRRELLTQEQGVDPYLEYCDVLDALLAWVKG